MNYVISNDKLSIQVSPHGAELQSIYSNKIQYLWDGDPEFWPDRSPLLFPFVGRLTGGQYRYKGSLYNMDIHGFARRMEFAVTERAYDSIELVVTDNAETFKIYPFHFVLKVKYILKGNTVQIGYQVENTSDDTMCFGIGGHPGFRVPIEDGLAFSDYFLEFPAKHTPTRVGHTETCFLNGCDTAFFLEEQYRLPLNHSMFDEDAIVLKDVADRVVLKSDKSIHSITVTYHDMPYLGLWHAPRTEAPYICIEPWTSLASRQDITEDFQFKSDLIRLHSQDKYQNQWEITIE